jgi:hypothetical protein
MPDPGNDPPANLVKKIFRRLFTELLGEGSFNILELQLRRALGEDPYAVLCRDPARFSAELRNMLGSELDNLLKIAASRLADNYSLEKLDMRASSRKIDEVFLDLLFEVARRAVGRIAPGAVCLTPREAYVISRLLELAEAGGIDERVCGEVGWAVKIKTILILGIRFGDEIVPLALYSRRYARFGTIARRWLEESLSILRTTINELK